MSEYWKSTPKYWCKHCKTFVRDTKLEKTNHEATPKHQGNIKRFLRDLHRGHEREERDKRMAKNEVDRLNGIVSSSALAAGALPSERKSAIPSSNNTSRQATPAEMKAQLAQLAEMGVAVPEDCRGDMAMAGDWQTTSRRLVYDDVKKEEEEEDTKPVGMNIGVRKRKFEGQEEEEEAGKFVFGRGWGSATRTYPGAAGGDDDLESLLRTTNRPNMSNDTPQSTNLSKKVVQEMEPEKDLAAGKAMPSIKQEEYLDANTSLDVAPEPSIGGMAQVKSEQDVADAWVVFKKRKSKPIRQERVGS